MSAGTSRLKRKLNEQGINYSTGKATENFCLIGTPLPPLEKSKDSGEFVPIWKQDVRDEQGRRRLHGAFTGGFSAGYFNSVGSKEGWAPSTFKSSRSERGKKAAARPEDYMDEEDLAELRESQLMTGMKEQRDIMGGTQAELAGRSDPTQDSIASSIERALMPPPDDSPGVRLLKAMGWRPGQGVGPRVTWRQRKIQDLLAAGKSLNNIDIDALEEDEEAKKHMYPPRDTAVPRVSKKNDSHGVGFVAQLGLNETLGRNSGAKGPTLAAGFGLGALNEAEDDDVDVYDTSSHHDRTYMPYDSVRDAEEDGRHGRDTGNAKASRTSARQRFKSGVPVVEGFVFAATTAKDDLWFPLPDIPEGWKPDPRRVWQKDSTNKENDTVKSEVGTQPSWRSKMTASERGSVLGETPLPREQRSVFDYLSKADRERIQNAASRSHPDATTSPSAAPKFTEPETKPSIPYTPPNIASAALRGFVPFPTDPVKQARYVAYLRSQASPDDPSLVPVLLPGQSASGFNKELSDYAKSAAIFKPVEGAMASRFTSAAVVDFGPKIIEGLHQPVHQTPSDKDDEERAKEKAREKETERREEVVEGSKAHAVKMGMYGALTREVTPWQPSRLLCKRFGVKDPNADITTDVPLPGVASTGWQPEQALAEADLQTAGGTPGGVPVGAAASGMADSGGRKTRNLENVGLGEDEDQGRDILTYVRPSMDIFKAIFASDDEDSGDEDEGASGGKDKEDADVEMPPVSANTAPPPVPAHLRVDNNAEPSAAYESRASERPSSAEQVVDIATFKPVFVPPGERETKKSNHKKDKEKKRAKATVSFVAMDEDDVGGLVIAPVKSVKDGKEKHKDRKKKRRKEDSAGEGGGDEDVEMWVEKAPPEAVKAFAGAPVAVNVGVKETPVPPPPPTQDTGGDQEVRPPRGRKRAVDFM